jgi:hypothetical protein
MKIMLIIALIGISFSPEIGQISGFRLKLATHSRNDFAFGSTHNSRSLAFGAPVGPRAINSVDV